MTRDGGNGAVRLQQDALQQLEFGYLLGSESRFVEQLMWKLRTAVILCLAMQTFVPPALLFS